MKDKLTCPTCKGTGIIKPWEGWEPFTDEELQDIEDEILKREKASEQAPGVTLGYTRRFLATIRQLKAKD